ncbi:MAG TPA: hypothetical protein VMW63_02935 [Methanoregulaceae archaeon]|nr:hypothetical protein [Methanoregulaceae archaeon]
MPEEKYRVLPVKGGKVCCLPQKEVDIEHCRFCVFSRYFRVRGVYVKSPALAYCTTHRATEEVDLKLVDAVKCGDRRGDGFQSIMNIIG